MTEEKLKQEAKEFINNRFKHEVLGKRFQEFFTFWELICSIVDFAEPREKRIVELEQENAKQKDEIEHAKIIIKSVFYEINQIWDSNELERELIKDAELFVGEPLI